MRKSQDLNLMMVLVWFFSAYAFAGHLFIYDFDQTLTKDHTFHKTQNGIDKAADVRDEMKELAGETLRSVLKSGNHLAIASFHTRKDVIRHYLRSVLSQEEVAQIKIAVRDGKRFAMNKMADKDKYISHLMHSFIKDGHIVESVSFYDDSWENVTAFERFFAKSSNAVEGFRVSKDPKNNEHFVHTQEKIERLRKARVSCPN